MHHTPIKNYLLCDRCDRDSILKKSAAINDVKTLSSFDYTSNALSLRMREENGVFFKPVFKIKFKYMIYDDLDRSGYI